MAMSMSGMDMGTATGTAAMASSTAMAGMSSMNMGGDCKISMLWNWYTLDACFLAPSWHITSKGMFAGSCIGVILLVIFLEFLRRAGKEYDRYIVAQYTRSLSTSSRAAAAAPTSSASSTNAAKNGGTTATTLFPFRSSSSDGSTKFRPNVLQQSIRALLHMLQFAVAYFVMLLAMYYNGYIIICIFIGAYLGHFIFGWESFNVGKGGNDRLEEEVTVCCG